MKGLLTGGNGQFFASPDTEVIENTLGRIVKGFRKVMQAFRIGAPAAL
jgi:hypothetical protein